MADEPHDVVKLLAARMGSHPEEFTSKQGLYHSRWFDHISAVNSYGNEADKAALNAKMRDVRMAELHEQVMDELLNGPDKRRKEEEEAEYERKLVILTAQKAHQKQIQQNNQTAMQKIDTSNVAKQEQTNDRVPIHKRLVQLGTGSLEPAYPHVTCAAELS